MSFFVSATPAPLPKTKNIHVISLFTAAIFVVMAVAQLFSFEDFSSVLSQLKLPGGNTTTYFMSAVIVIAEVFALPFLLAMPLSPLFRRVSMALGWFVVLFWLMLLLWGSSAAAGMNSGVLGATVSIPLGWWLVFLFLAVGVLVVWTSWGMWEMNKTNKIHG